MINIYLNQVERELDELLALQKMTSDYLRIAEDVYAALDEGMGHNALKIIALFNVLKRQNELDVIQRNIELSQKTIKDLHNVRRTHWKERSIERTNDEPE